MACAHLQPTDSSWPRDGVRLFNVAVTRVRTRLYVIAGGERVKNAEPGTALAQLAALIGTRRGVRVLQAKTLITPPSAPPTFRGAFGTALAEVLSRHVEVTEIDDERDFFRTFTEEIRHARQSLWLWAPWGARRVSSLLPELRAVADRGVRISVFIRDDTDQLQKKPANQQLITELRAVAQVLVPMNVMHQKIAVIDERTVMLGSLNVLAQSWTREVMLTMRGGYFARKLLEHEHAAVFAAPPRCGRCNGAEIEIRPQEARRLGLALLCHCLQDHAGGRDERLDSGHPPPAVGMAREGQSTGLPGWSWVEQWMPPPAPDWGRMVFDGQTAIQHGYPLSAVLPCVLIVLTVVAFNVVGEQWADRVARRDR